MLTEILKRHDAGPAAGAYRWYAPDLALLPEYALALMEDDIRRRGGIALSADRLLIAADHFAPPATIERAAMLRMVQDLCATMGWEPRLFEGICHQLLTEDARTLPGTLIIGSDSHTVTAGALGCFAAGFGSTDVYGALITGKIALRAPRLIRIVIAGSLPPGVMGKDVILELFRRCGAEKLNGAGIEFIDETRSRICQSDRFAICNLIAECGAEAALFLPDDVTEAFLAERDGNAPPLPGIAEESYDEEIVIDAEALEPLVALPGSPFRVAALRAYEGLPLHQVFLGSCAAGRLEDFAVAAAILDGRRVAPGLKAIAIPASAKVYLAALEAGYIATLVAAGVCIGNPSCGPCGAIDKGVLAPGERCAATINRNYEGRMGAPDAEIYLVNAAAAAAAMATGKLTDPRKLL